VVPLVAVTVAEVLVVVDLVVEVTVAEAVVVMEDVE
jgi:hypothetical protein